MSLTRFTFKSEYGEFVRFGDVIELLRKEAAHRKQIADSIAMDDYMSDSDSEAELWASAVLNMIAEALIKGEQK